MAKRRNAQDVKSRVNALAVVTGGRGPEWAAAGEFLKWLAGERQTFPAALYRRAGHSDAEIASLRERVVPSHQRAATDAREWLRRQLSTLKGGA